MSKQDYKNQNKLQKQQYKLEKRKLDPRDRFGDSQYRAGAALAAKNAKYAKLLNACNQNQMASNH